MRRTWRRKGKQQERPRALTRAPDPCAQLPHHPIRQGRSKPSRSRVSIWSTLPDMVPSVSTQHRECYFKRVGRDKFFIEWKGHWRNADKFELTLTEGTCCMSRFQEMYMLDVSFTHPSCFVLSQRATVLRLYSICCTMVLSGGSLRLDLSYAGLWHERMLYVGPREPSESAIASS